MTTPKLQYKKMKMEELIVLAQQDDMLALEELLKKEQKNVFTTFELKHNEFFFTELSVNENNPSDTNFSPINFFIFFLDLA